jgi:hypothetical protein
MECMPVLQTEIGKKDWALVWGVGLNMTEADWSVYSQIMERS